jgi:phenylpropionate dioxygenase-like ring-hydroxylating dioxygenase large terminal subunit
LTTKTISPLFLEELSAWYDRSQVDALPTALPAEVYTSQDILGLEKDLLFKQEWVCVGHVSELPEVGDYLTFDLIGHPLLILRDEEKDIRSYSSVCRHRSAIIANGSGNAKSFTCPYHAWTYNIDGTLRAAPYMAPADLEGVCLHEYPVEIWQGLIFTSLNAKAIPLAPRLVQLMPRIDTLNLQDMTVIYQEEQPLACNWKVLVENFCESYHVFKVHKDTLQPITPSKTIDVHEGGTGFNHHTMLAVGPQATERQRATEERDHLINIFPSLVVSISQRNSIFLSIRPIDPHSLTYHLWIAMDLSNPEVTPDLIQQVIESTRTFTDEDKAILTEVQKGLVTGVGNKAPLHKWEQTNLEFGQYLSRKLIGSE